MGERNYSLCFMALSIMGTVMWVTSWFFAEPELVDYGGMVLIALMWITSVVLFKEDRRERRQSVRVTDKR